MTQPYEDKDKNQKQAQIEPERRRAIESELLFIELKDEVSQRLLLPSRVPILKSDLETEYKNGVIPPSAWAAGIEALKILHPELREYDNFLARYYLLEGRRALDENDQYEAKRFYQKTLDLDLGELSGEAAFYLAALSNGDPEQAIKYYQRSIELNPGAATPHYELAKILRERRDLQGAMYEFSLAAQIEPNSASVINEMAETYLMANDLTAARNTFKEAIHVEPNNWVLLVKLGMTEYKLEEYQQAIKDLRRGLDNSPEELEEGNEQAFYVEGLYYLGKAYQDNGDTIRASKLFKTVLSIAPEHLGAIQALSI